MTILDSGDRRSFPSGAVRDMAEGKGRCDLVPLRVAAKIKGDDLILQELAAFMEEPTNTEPLYNAMRCFLTIVYWDVETMLLTVAKHFEDGAKKYGENNWQKGIPPHNYIDSAIRHYLKFCRGDDDEPHERAFVWNLMCCAWEVDHHYTEGKSDD